MCSSDLATAEGKDPLVYCNEWAGLWESFVKTLGISNDDFVRTTQERHREVVQALLAKLQAQGEIYKAPYHGWYSWRQETFLTEKDRLPDGSWDPIYGEVTELIEENWYFRMGRHQAWLLEYIEANPHFVQPDRRRNEVLGFLRSETLEDLCISRPKARLGWGIPIPFDPDYVVYVWFDALVNYLSVPAALGDGGVLRVLGDCYRPGGGGGQADPETIWPADIHLVGKDIRKFHAVYWPIMLKVAGAALPGQILVHGWWQKDGQKLSKSTGNVVDPLAVIREWGLDAFRYYVVRELDIGPDGNWTDAGFAQRYAAELANGLGNLVNRSLSMLQRYRGGVVPAVSRELASDVEAATRAVEGHLRTSHLQAALVDIWELIARANQYVDRTAPFKLAKDPTQAGRLDEVLYNLAEVCRVIAVLVWPFMPDPARRIFGQLKVEGEPGSWSNTPWGGLRAGHRIGEPAPLFPRRDLPAKA